MRIIVFDHENQILLEELSTYKLPIEVRLVDARVLIPTLMLEYEKFGLVSPANSFGFMNGGIDAVYAEMFPGIEDALRRSIAKRNIFNEIMIGQALTIYWLRKIYFIAAPTMRVPGKIKDPSDIYLATRAAIYDAKDHRIDCVAIPGMGTGVGGVYPSLAARNMAMGIKHALDGAPIYETCAKAGLSAEVLKNM